MSVEIKCDECGTRLDEGENIYCQSCIDKLSTQLAEKDKQIEQLKNDNIELQTENERLSKELDDHHDALENEIGDI